MHTKTVKNELLTSSILLVTATPVSKPALEVSLHIQALHQGSMARLKTSGKPEANMAEPWQGRCP